MEIFVVTHKNVKIPSEEIYKGIQVGKAGQDFGLAYRDNMGDNIMEKNDSYCELTALYWIWKNVKTDEIVGMVHYRRFFRGKHGILTGDEIEKTLLDYEIILPEPEYILKYTVGEQWNAIHNAEDLDLVRKILEKKYPDYVDAFDEVLRAHDFYAYNMFIARKPILDEYAKWLFGILGEVEKEVDLDEYDDYNKRLFGFISERLLNVWVKKNNLKVKTLPVINTEEKLMSKLKRKVKKIYGGKK